jgi:hypothetical protein
MITSGLRLFQRLCACFEMRTKKELYSENKTGTLTLQYAGSSHMATAKTF